MKKLVEICGKKLYLKIIGSLFREKVNKKGKIVVVPLSIERFFHRALS